MSKFKRSSPKHSPQLPTLLLAYAALHWQALAAAALIAAAVFLVYYPSLNGDFILDDDKLLMDNEHIWAPDGLYRFWCTREPIDYWPVTNTTLWIEWRLWGMRPIGYRVTNLVLHIAASLLIWVILRKLAIPGAFLAALIFAVHPVNVESVAWISQRKDALAIVFFLLSILWYLKAETRDEGRKERGEGRAKREEGKKDSHDSHSALIPHLSSLIPHPYWYGLSLLAFALGMLSKGSIAILPMVLLGIVWWRRKVTWWDLVRTAPFFAVAVTLTLVNIWFQYKGSGEVIRDISYVQRLLGAGAVEWFYLYKAILPINLVFIYPQWDIQANNPLWWLSLAAAVIVTAVLWWYRQDWSRPFLFAWGFFCVALVPVMGLTDVGFMKHSLVADHYQHVAIIGVIALAAAGWSTWRQRVSRVLRWTAGALAVLVVGVLALLTWRQNELYCDATTLYQTTLERNPNCWLIHNNLGILLYDAGKLQEALEHYEQTLALNPKYAEAHNNLGNTLGIMGRPLEALEHYRQAIQLVPENPVAFNNLGFTLTRLGRLSEAIEQYLQAIKLKPSFAGAHDNLGLTLMNAGRLPEAIERYRWAVRLDPKSPKIRIHLGHALTKAGRFPEAIEHYKQALRLNPMLLKAHNDMANALLKTGRLPEAIEHYRQALQLAPNLFEAHNNLGNALKDMGRLPEAIEHYKTALRLRPGFIPVWMNLARTYQQANRRSDALSAAQRALNLARAVGNTNFVKQIEEWITSYHTRLSTPPSPPPSREPVVPSP